MESPTSFQDVSPKENHIGQSGYSFTQDQLSKYSVHNVKTESSCDPSPKFDTVLEVNDPGRASVLKFQAMWKRLSNHETPQAILSSEAEEVASLRLSEVSKSLLECRSPEPPQSIKVIKNDQEFSYAGPVMVVSEKSLHIQAKKEEQRKSLKKIAVALAKSILAFNEKQIESPQKPPHKPPLERRERSRDLGNKSISKKIDGVRHLEDNPTDMKSITGNTRPKSRGETPESKRLSSRVKKTPQQQDIIMAMSSQDCEKLDREELLGCLRAINLEERVAATKLIADLRRNHSKELDSATRSILDNSRFRCAYACCQKQRSREKSKFLLCDFCGPCSRTRYCSEKCRLIDSADHFFICGLDCFEWASTRRNGAILAKRLNILSDIHGYNNSKRQRQFFHHLYGEDDYTIFLESEGMDSISLNWPEKSLEQSNYHLPTRHFIKKLLDAAFHDHKKICNVSTLYRLIRHRLSKGPLQAAVSTLQVIKSLNMQFKAEFNFKTDILDCHIEDIHEEIQCFDWTCDNRWTLVSR